jgi:hypothetical protein
MDNSQAQLIKDKAFLDIRERVATILLEQNILDTHGGSVGWWVHNGTSTFISLYDVLEEARV